MPQNVFQNGPYLQGAILCSYVLEEKDGTKTAVRIIDRFTISTRGPQAPEGIPPNQVFSGYLLMRFKKGEEGNSHNLRMEIANPVNEVTSTFIHTLTFEGGADRGVDLMGPVQMEIDRDGVYWFNIFLDDVQITRVPLRVVYVREQTIQGSLPERRPH